MRGLFNVVGLIEAVSGDQVGGEGGAADAGAWTGSCLQGHLG